MSLAEKLTTIAENIPKVYNSGYEKGKAEGGDDIDWSLCTNFSYLSPNNSRNFLIPQLNYENTGNGTVFNHMFNGCSALTEIPLLNTSKGTVFNHMFNGCSALTEIPELDVSNGTNFANMFANCSKLTKVPPLLNTSKGTNFASMFNTCTALTEIPEIDTSNGTNFTFMFNSCKALVRIPKLDVSKGTNFERIFYDCVSLEEVRFDGSINASILFSQSPKLSHDSLTSIINALADFSEDTSGKTFKLTLGATNLAKLTEDELNIIYEKGWTYS